MAKSDPAEYEKYAKLRDENIISLIREGDRTAQDFMISKYKSLVKVKSRTYFLIGADREDIIQEGMIGLYKAIRDFNKDKLASFHSFAEICVTRQIITAIKTATRQKHIPLNSYISLNKSVDEGETVRSYIDLLVETSISSPEDIFIDQEDKSFIEKNIAETLSLLECKVLYLYMQGKSYLEIACMTDKNEKSIDNAIQRIRRKVEKILAEKNLTKAKKYARI
jgi:RNA polymerase sporulation-specific sigma factor